MVKVFLIKSILLRAMHVGELYKMVGSCLWKKKWKNRITSSDNACLYPIWQHQNPTPHSQIFTPVDISKQILHVLVNVNSAILELTCWFFFPSNKRGIRYVVLYFKGYKQNFCTEILFRMIWLSVILSFLAKTPTNMPLPHHSRCNLYIQIMFVNHFPICMFSWITSFFYLLRQGRL